jgi:hypothetical protein
MADLKSAPSQPSKGVAPRLGLTPSLGMTFVQRERSGRGDKNISGERAGVPAVTAPVDAEGTSIGA